MEGHEKFISAMADFRRDITRTIVQGLNTRALAVARSAHARTRKASREKIQSEMFRSVKSTRTTQSGRVAQGDAPLVALLIQAERSKRGQPGLYGRDMALEIKRVMDAKFKSIGFIKNGWLPAIQRLSQSGAGTGSLPSMDTSVPSRGSPKGSASPASANSLVVTIENRNISKSPTSAAALERIGGAGLRAGFDAEGQSLDRHLENAMRADCAEATRRMS